MATINAYLTFNGDCEAAFTFYQSVFGGNFDQFNRFKDMPDTDNTNTTAAEGEKIMHVSLPISKETVLMGSDTSVAFGQPVATGNNIALSINTDSKEEAEKLFNGLSAEGQVTMPLADTFWGAYFGMFTDKFGINWMVNYDSAETQ